MALSLLERLRLNYTPKEEHIVNEFNTTIFSAYGRYRRKQTVEMYLRDMAQKTASNSRPSTSSASSRTCLLKGHLDPLELTEQPSKVIRVYLSCTSTDTVEERKKLMTDGIPKIREYARDKYALEFQVVDPRWGTFQDWDDWDSTRDLSTREILECKRMTPTGPNFITMIGQRYGTIPLPLSIPADHFDTIRTSLANHRNRQTRDFGLLDVWYSLDSNVVPPIYRLVSKSEGQVTEKIFYSENSLLYHEKANAPFDWIHTREALIRLFHNGVEHSVKDGLINPDIGFWYITSDLERDIELGLMRAPDTSRNCQVYLRDIVDLKNYTVFPRAKYFTELSFNEKKQCIELHSDRLQRIQRLREERVCMVMPPDLVFHGDFLWRHDKGVDPDFHADYLHRLNEAFVEKTTAQVDAYAKELPSEEPDPLIREIRHHWQVVKEKSCDFIGRDYTLDTIREYLLGQRNSVFVVHGVSGSGKSAVMAKAAALTHEWLGSRSLVIVRFIGSTASSFDTRQLMYSICQQVALALGAHPDSLDVPNTYKELQQYFLDTLMDIPEDRTLVLYLDSLDTLVPQYNAHFLNWLPQELCSNVRIVLSTLPNSHNLLQRLREDIVQSKDCIYELGPLELKESMDLLRSRLTLENRRLQDFQEAIVYEAFRKCSYPLYVLMMMREVRQWYSTTEPGMLPEDMKEFLDDLFTQLEAKHGKMLVDHALSFLTASSTGVSDCEMEDLLSLDDVVLGELATARQGKEFPVRRLPGVFWMRLKKDVRDYLVEREAEGVTVSNWFHRQFIEAVRDRYLVREDKRQFIHSALADYHLGLWHARKKPYTYPLQKGTGDVQIADRYVVSQPLTFKGTSDGDSTMYNRRKYEQVPRHLYLSGRLAELNTFVLFSYSFLYNKTKALSLEHVLADFVLNPGVEATLVERALRDAQPFMELNIDNMAPELVGRLLPYYKSHNNVRKLIRECDSAGSVHCGIMPNFPYHQVPGSPLRYAIQCADVIDDIQLVCEDCRFAFAKNRNRTAIHMMDLATGEYCGSINTSLGAMKLTPNSQYVVVYDVKYLTVKIHLADDGQYVGQLIPKSFLPPGRKYKFGPLSVTDNFLVFIITGETSHLFLADLEFCKITEVIQLEGRASICEISPDGRYVFTNATETLMSFDMSTSEQVCTTPLTVRPIKIVFMKDGSRAFHINNKEQIVHVLSLRDGEAEFEYKLPLEDAFPEDSFNDIVLAENQNMLLIRGKKTLAVYQMSAEKVIAVFTRPVDVPLEFKLPCSNYRQIYFTQAAFSPDSKFVIASIFRNVYIWNVGNGNLLTTLQAPVGLITDLVVPNDRGQIVTHLEDQKHIQVWSLGDAIGHVGMVDRLTHPIREIVFDKNDQVAFVACDDSDEIGLFSMTTGLLIDLLTHESPVQDFKVSCNGNHVFVALTSAKAGLYNKIWDVPGRRVIYEFGSLPAYLLPFNKEETLVCLLQSQNKFQEPYRLNKINLQQGTYEEFQLEQQFPYVLDTPFITSDDRYLVILTAERFDPIKVEHTNPTLAVVPLKSQADPSYYSAEDIRKLVRMRRILHVRPCAGNEYTVLILFTNEPSPEVQIVDGMRTKRYDYAFGFLLFDIAAGVVCQVIDDFVPPQTPLKTLLFNTTATLCVDQDSNLYNMGTGYFVKQIHFDKKLSPALLALNAKIVVYTEGRHLFAVRISDRKMIGHVNVHGEIKCVRLCHDDRTLVVGCHDGAVVSYVLLDVDMEPVDMVVGDIKSRALPLNKQDSDISVDFSSQRKNLTSRSWDKVDFENHLNAPPYSRPPSGIIRGPTDTELLKRVRHVNRPRTTSGRLQDAAMSLSRPGTSANVQSSACAVM